MERKTDFFDQARRNKLSELDRAEQERAAHRLYYKNHIQPQLEQCATKLMAQDDFKNVLGLADEIASQIEQKQSLSLSKSFHITGRFGHTQEGWPEDHIENLPLDFLQNLQERNQLPSLPVGIKVEYEYSNERHWKCRFQLWIYKFGVRKDEKGNPLFDTGHYRAWFVFGDTRSLWAEIDEDPTLIARKIVERGYLDDRLYIIEPPSHDPYGGGFNL